MYRNKVDSKYARSQMEKHGWREGAGLGKEEHGMRDIIKVQLRSSRTGVGHDLSKEFTNNWWEDVYNRGASSLKVENGKDGAVVSIVKDAAKQQQKKKADKMALLYGRFRKGATLTTSDEGQVEVKHDDGHNDDSSDEDKPKKYLTFEEMFQACEGRTCHRGVRHGHSVSAKLRRVEEMDRALLSGQSPLEVGLPPTHPPSSEGKKKKKKKKRTKERKEEDEEESPTSKSSEEACEPVKSKGENSACDSIPASPGCDEEGLERKKKKKRRKQKKEEEEEGEDTHSSDAAAISDNTRHTASAAEEVSKKDKKKKKKKREENLDENCSTKNGEEDSEGKKEKEKKRKRRSEEEKVDENCSDCVEEDTDFPCWHEVSAKKKAKKSDAKERNSGGADGEAEKVSKKKRRRKDNE